MYTDFLCVGPASSYHYTNQGGDFPLTSVDDLAEFEATQEALQLLGFHDNHQQLYAVLAGILNLGNVEVGVAQKGGEEVGSVLPGNQWLKRSAELLEVDSAHLCQWLTHRSISTVRETIIKPLTPTQVS